VLEKTTAAIGGKYSLRAPSLPQGEGISFILSRRLQIRGLGGAAYKNEGPVKIEARGGREIRWGNENRPWDIRPDARDRSQEEKGQGEGISA